MKANDAEASASEAEITLQRASWRVTDTLLKGLLTLC